ncbi:alkaline phosphatase [Kineobactrum sediminis]|uniref:Alkaline phosphatase n=1 Tax=Kineobactrum sediminis TaxID=1905677 RepID=A0A2N5Y1R0_9GAMM|nr:alkaline phosphatase D family protein [Kineobactrum sediminis]PLW82330.1 alkaline phosphatase [Kineobactrum sediminis]
MSDNNDFRRRTLVKGIAAASLLPLLGSNLIACSDSRDLVPEPAGVAAQFNHGVASGDPLADRVILWTRVTPDEEGFVDVEWEVASDEDFTDIVRSGAGVTDAAVDFTVKVDVDGLAPGTSYFYRFRVIDRVSPVALTRTAPAGAAASAVFAVVSCSNYPTGFFNVYREVALQEVDAVLHLGDYIYEYAPDGYASSNAEALDRVVTPATEIVTLSDYRARYAQYRTDPDLQAAHAAHPFIVVWDDHEIANDTWREGAENHDPDSEGEFSERLASAIQAWYEWLPVRPPANEQEIIYRLLPYGDLLDLVMLDTRVIGRDQQFVYPDFVTGGVIDVAATRAAVSDSRRTLLGETQLTWLKDKLTSSNARWQVLGQQVLMGRYDLPSPVLQALEPSIAGDDPLAEGVAAVLAAVAAKNKPPAERTPEEQALLDSAIPYNLDAWDGYGFERDEVLEFVAQLDKRMIVLAGDTHNSWASQLRTTSGQVAGVEFATSSVTSPGLELVLGADAAAFFAPLMTTLVDDLVYADFNNRGYLTVRFEPETVTAEWRYVSAIDSRDYVLNEEAFHQRIVNHSDLVLS